MREGRWRDAIAMMETLRTEAVNLPGLEIRLNLLLATCFQRLGEHANEEKAYQRVVNTDPKNVLARVGLGNLYMNLGRFDDAATELDIAVKSPYATGAVVSLWATLKTRLLSRKIASDAWVALGQTLASLASRFSRGSSEPVLLLAEMISAQGRQKDTIKMLRQEATRRPGDARLWSALALATADVAGTPAGLVVMDEAQATAGDCVEVRLARARLYAREPGRVRPIDSLGEGIESWAESEQIRLLSGLVEIYDQLGDRANVVHTLHRIVARQPDNAAMWLKLHVRRPRGGSPRGRGPCRPGEDRGRERAFRRAL